jgi:aspartyl-tRNA(Asn)/glutamyl-tRNA(Gln) amidotransferase subunit A
LPQPRRRLRRRGQAPHHDGHLRAVGGLIADDFRRAFAEVDVIAGPTAPTAAFKLGDKTDDPITMYLNDIYTVGANLAGLPGISVPCGFVDGLPIGLHLVAPHFGESVLLRCAHQYQQQTDWHTACPEGFQ